MWITVKWVHGIKRVENHWSSRFWPLQHQCVRKRKITSVCRQIQPGLRRSERIWHKAFLGSAPSTTCFLQRQPQLHWKQCSRLPQTFFALSEIASKIFFCSSKPRQCFKNVLYRYISRNANAKLTQRVNSEKAVHTRSNQSRQRNFLNILYQQ